VNQEENENKMEEKLNFGNISNNINNVNELYGGQVIGQGHTTGKYAVGSGLINITGSELSRIDKQYAKIMRSFLDNLNEQFRENNIPQRETKEIQHEVLQFTKELENIKPDSQIGIVKKTNLRTRLVNIASYSLSILPKTMQVIAAFTPLAPFSNLIGENIDTLVKAIQQEVS
jgi:hypothetical protein